METSDEWIRQRSGIVERRWAENGVGASDLAERAAAASIPIALHEAVEEGRVKSGDLVCLTAFGSGFTWGSALIRW